MRLFHGPTFSRAEVSKSPKGGVLCQDLEVSLVIPGGTAPLQGELDGGFLLVWALACLP